MKLNASKNMTNKLLENKKIQEIIEEEIKNFGFVRSEIYNSLESIANIEENIFDNHRYYVKK